MSALDTPAACATSSSDAPWWPDRANVASAAARITSRRWAAGMRRRRAAGAMTVPPVGDVRLLTRLPGMGVDFASEGLLDGLDGEAVRTFAAFRRAGVSDEQILRAIRVLGRGMAQGAETLRASGLELAPAPRSSEAEIARRFAERSAALVPMLGPMLEQMLRLHLRHAVGT